MVVTTFGTQKDPVILDPRQTIVKFHRGDGPVLLVEITKSLRSSFSVATDDKGEFDPPDPLPDKLPFPVSGQPARTIDPNTYKRSLFPPIGYGVFKDAGGYNLVPAQGAWLDFCSGSSFAFRAGAPADDPSTLPATEASACYNQTQLPSLSIPNYHELDLSRIRYFRRTTGNYDTGVDEGDGDINEWKLEWLGQVWNPTVFFPQGTNGKSKTSLLVQLGGKFGVKSIKVQHVNSSDHTVGNKIVIQTGTYAYTHDPLDLANAEKDALDDWIAGDFVHNLRVFDHLGTGLSSSTDGYQANVKTPIPSGSAEIRVRAYQGGIFEDDKAGTITWDQWPPPQPGDKPGASGSLLWDFSGSAADGPENTTVDYHSFDRDGIVKS